MEGAMPLIEPVSSEKGQQLIRRTLYPLYETTKQASGEGWVARREMLIRAAPRKVKHRLHRMARLLALFTRKNPQAGETKQTDSNQRGLGIRGWICSSELLPALRLHAMPCRLLRGRWRVHVMRLLVTAVISPRRFVGDGLSGR